MDRKPRHCFDGDFESSRVRSAPEWVGRCFGFAFLERIAYQKLQWNIVAAALCDLAGLGLTPLWNRKRCCWDGCGGMSYCRGGQQEWVSGFWFLESFLASECAQMREALVFSSCRAIGRWWVLLD